MVAPIKLPPLELLRDKFTYNPDTGVLVHNKTYSSYIKRGDIAGYKRSDGYIQVKVSGTAYLSHRICYYLQTGTEPNYVDHINRVRDDNRFSNLTSVTHAVNMNNKTDYKNNRTGERNITKRGKYYVVTFRRGGISHHVWQGTDFQEAIRQRDNWADTH